GVLWTNAATAPPRWALKTFSLKPHVPRSMSAIFPVSEPAGNGLTSPAAEQPSVPLSVATFWAGTTSAGPNGVVSCGPKLAGPTASPVRLAGTGAGAVTSTLPGTTVAFLVTAPTLITLGEFAGELTDASSGPALPAANTIVTPASVAFSAACTIGSGHAAVFW